MMLDCGQLSCKMLAASMQVFLFALSVPLCSNFPESPGITGFLSMMVAVTSGILVKNVYML